VLLFDDLTQDPSLSPRVRELGRRFVSRMAPGDRMGIATLDRDLIEFSDDPAWLRKRVDDHFGGRGGQPLDLIGELLFERLTAVARQVAEAPGRKAVVAIGNGGLFDRPIHPSGISADLRPEWTEAVRALASANLPVYVMDPAGVGYGAGTGDSGFARETGGYAFLNTNDFDAVVERVIREMDNHYVIAFADPPIHRKSDLRELDVRVTRKGVVVRAGRWIPGAAGR
jgi:VWFA-related protein